MKLQAMFGTIPLVRGKGDRAQQVLATPHPHAHQGLRGRQPVKSLKYQPVNQPPPLQKRGRVRERG